MRLAIRVVVVATGLTLATASPAAAAEVELVKPQDGTTYELAPEATSLIKVPLDIGVGVDAAKLKLELRRVRLGTARDIIAPEAFGMSFQPAPPAILIDVSLDDAPHFGTYHLSISVAHEGDTQRLVLQLERPAARMDAPAELVVERTRILPFLGVDEEKPVLQLIERAGTRLSGVVVRQIDSAVGGVHFRNPPLQVNGRKTDVVEPERSATAPYTVDDVKTGKVSRTVEVLSPQLDQPVKITFEIQTRWHWAWILVWGALGLLLGWVLRTKARNYVEVRQQRLLALELERSMSDERRLHADATFRKTVDELLGRLRELRGDPAKWTDAVAVSDVAREVKAALQIALQKLSERRKKVVAALDALRGVTASSWRVPGSVAAAVAEAEAKLANADAQITDDDIGDLAASPRTGAANTISVAEAELRAVIEREAFTWAESVRLGLDASAARAQDAHGAPLLRTCSDAASAVAELDAARGESQAKTIELMEAFETAYEALWRIVAPARGVVANVGRARGSGPLALAQDVQRLDAGVEAVEADLAELTGPQAAATPDGARTKADAALRRLPGDVQDLLDAADAAVRSVAGRQGLPPKAEQALARLDYATAAAQARPEDELLGEGATEAPAAAAGAPAPRSVRRTSRTVIAERAPMLPIDVAIARTLSEIRRANAYRSLLAAAIFLVTAVPLFKGDFVGSFNDVLKIVLWAFAADFAVDFSVDRVVALAGAASGRAETATPAVLARDAGPGDTSRPEEGAHTG